MVHEETKVKARHWAKKLECPVDDNANYENTYVGLSILGLTVDLSD
jgi:hypothetical protein